MLVWNTWKCLLAGALFASVATLPLAAQSNSSSLNASSPTVPPIEGGTGYNQPPENILKVMHAPFPPYPAVSPTGDSILLVYVQNYPSIARVATPFLRLAGVRVEPRNHSKHDTPGGYGITECGTGFDLVHIPDGTQAHIALPVGACPGEPTWSADGRRFAFVNLAAEAVELWIGDGKTGEVHRVAGVRLNPMFNDEMQWMADQKTLLVKLVPEGWARRPRSPLRRWVRASRRRRRKRAEQHL